MSILETNKIQAFDGDNVTLSATNNIQIQANLYVSGTLAATDATFSGTVTAKEFHTAAITSSILYQSGSTRMGDSADDTHTIIGGIYHTGRTQQTGDYYLIGELTQSGEYNLTGNKTHTGDLNQVGDIDLTGTLAITGVSNVSSSISTLTTDQRNISASFSTSETLLSSSVSTSITNLTSATSASDAVLTTQLLVATASIAVNEANINTLTAATSSYALGSDLTTATGRITVNEGHIANLHAFTGSLNDTYATDAELSAVSGALATSINTSVAGLNAASSSYALAADLTVATGSINVNETNIGLLTALTGSLVSTQTAYNTASGSYITSASLAADYVSKARLKAIVTGSIDFATFQTNILSL